MYTAVLLYRKLCMTTVPYTVQYYHPMTKSLSTIVSWCQSNTAVLLYRTLCMTTVYYHIYINNNILIQIFQFI
jgi:hypothetical protein